MASAIGTPKVKDEKYYLCQIVEKLSNISVTATVPPTVTDRTHVGNEVINTIAGTVYTLSPPAGANIAEIQSPDSTILFRFGVSPTITPKTVLPLVNLELESADEISKFKFTTNANAYVVVDYFKIQNTVSNI